MLQSFCRVTLFSNNQDVIYTCNNTIGKKYPIIVEKNLSLAKFSTSVLIIIDSDIFIENRFFFSNLSNTSFSKIIFLLLPNAKCLGFDYIEYNFHYISSFPQNSQYLLKLAESILMSENTQKLPFYKFPKRFNNDSSNIFGFFGGSSKIMQQLRTQIRQAAKTNYSVLLLGETGTGKTSAAKTIHKLSSRKNFSMHSINIATVVNSLAESTFFGTTKGSYTGAENSEGIFKVADKSTLFLDEIGTMSLELQAKLLTVLDDGFINKVGSNKREKVDIRLVSSTNSNIKSLVTNGKFRSDLFYRISDFIINVPPLRTHKEDIRELCREFTKKTYVRFSESAFKKLEEYDWPGNIRDLHQCLKRALSRCTDGVIDSDLIDFGLYNDDFLQ